MVLANVVARVLLFIHLSTEGVTSFESLAFPKTWVPMASSFELDPNRPNALQFQGRNFVAYEGTNSNWVVCDSVCPHRLAPLEEGRIVNHTLECAYHGWTFNEHGECIRIPQVAKPEKAQQACSIMTYPTIVEKNIIWCWPWTDTSPDLELTPQVFLEGVDDNLMTYTRSLPYSVS